MWAQVQMPEFARKCPPRCIRPPLSIGMWAAQVRSTDEWGREIHEGGPRVWKAQPVRPENEPR